MTYVLWGCRFSSGPGAIKVLALSNSQGDHYKEMGRLLTVRESSVIEAFMNN